MFPAQKTEHRDIHIRNQHQILTIFGVSEYSNLRKNFFRPWPPGQVPRVESKKFFFRFLMCKTCFLVYFDVLIPNMQFKLHEYALFCNCTKNKTHVCSWISSVFDSWYWPILFFIDPERSFKTCSIEFYSNLHLFQWLHSIFNHKNSIFHPNSVVPFLGHDLKAIESALRNLETKRFFCGR